MRSRILIPLFLVIFLIGFNACKKSETCLPGPVEFTPIEISFICQNLLIDNELEDMFYVVHSQDRLKEIVNFDAAGENCQESLAELKNIDFSQHTLLIGKKVAPASGTIVSSEKVTMRCDPNKLVYELRMISRGYAVMNIYEFAVLIPKQSKNREIEFDIIIR